MKKIILLLTLTISTSTFAGLLLDPFVGYTFSGSISGDNDKTFSGTEVGARVGYSLLGAFAGIDYRMSNYEDDDGNTIKNPGRVALLAGFSFPILVRGWISYGLNSSLESEGYTYEQDQDITIGAGFTGFPLISVNFEINSSNINKVKGNGISTNTDSSVESYTLSVSAPFNF